jgi:hypothetical protein
MMSAETRTRLTWIERSGSEDERVYELIPTRFWLQDNGEPWWIAMYRDHGDDGWKALGTGQCPTKEAARELCEIDAAQLAATA